MGPKTWLVSLLALSALVAASCGPVHNHASTHLSPEARLHQALVHAQKLVTFRIHLPGYVPPGGKLRRLDVGPPPGVRLAKNKLPAKYRALELFYTDTAHWGLMIIEHVGHTTMGGSRNVSVDGMTLQVTPLNAASIGGMVWNSPSGVTYVLMSSHLPNPTLMKVAESLK